MSKSPQLKHVDQSLISGIAWTGTFRWAGQLVAWAATLIVARFLTPSDYGVFGVSTLFLGFLTMLADFGIGAAVVNLRGLSRAAVAQINTVSVLFGAGVCAIACAFAWPVGRFFGMPQVTPVIMVMSLTMMISSFRTVPWALLQKDLRFKRLAAFESIQVVLVSGLNVVLAYRGWGYWTLVLSAITSSTITTGLALRYHAEPFARPTWRTISEPLRFSSSIIVQKVAWYTYTSSDAIIVGRVFGSAVLGTYSLALTLADTPIQKVNEILSRVMPGIFSAVQDDKAALRRYFLAVTQILSLAVFPACIGMCLVSDDFVRVVLGPRWEPMIAPLRILAFYAAFKVLLPIMAVINTTTRQLRFGAEQMVLAAIVMPCAFYAGTWFGVTGVAAAWLLAHPLVSLRFYLRVTRVMNLRSSEYLRCLMPALSSTGVMACVVLALTYSGLLSGLPPWAQLMTKVGAGAAAYAGVIVLGHGETVRRLARLLMAARAAARVTMAPA